MIEAAVNWLAIGFRHALPMATAIFATFVDLLPLPDAGPAAIAPHLTLAVVFFWCVHRPELLPPGAIFATGLVGDVVAALPPGMNAFSLLIVPLLLRQAPKAAMAKSSTVVWGAFVVAAVTVGLVRWLLGTSFWESPLPFRPFLFEIAFTVAVFPLVSWLLSRLQELCLEKARVSGG